MYDLRDRLQLEDHIARPVFRKGQDLSGPQYGDCTIQAKNDGTHQGQADGIPVREKQISAIKTR